MINSPSVRAGRLFNGGSLCPEGAGGSSQSSRRMAEALRPGFGETASLEMLPEDGGCRPKARAGLASRRSSAHWPLTCCLLSIPILAALTTYLLVGQLRAQGEACERQVSETPR